MWFVYGPLCEQTVSCLFVNNEKVHCCMNKHHFYRFWKKKHLLMFSLCLREAIPYNKNLRYQCVTMPLHSFVIYNFHQIFIICMKFCRFKFIKKSRKIRNPGKIRNFSQWDVYIVFFSVSYCLYVHICESNYLTLLKIMWVVNLRRGFK